MEWVSRRELMIHTVPPGEKKSRPHRLLWKVPRQRLPAEEGLTTAPEKCALLPLIVTVPSLPISSPYSPFPLPCEVGKASALPENEYVLESHTSVFLDPKCVNVHASTGVHTCQA